MSAIQVATESAPLLAQGTPEDLSAKPASNGQLTDQELFAPFESARLEPNRISPLYRIGLVLVMAMMVLLPLIYVGLIGLIAYGVWVHMTNNTGILTAAHGSRGGRGALLAYCTPIVAGATAILFMIKPLFARAEGGAALLPRSGDGASIVSICATVVSHRPRTDAEANRPGHPGQRLRELPARFREHAGQRHGADDWIAAGFGNDAAPAHRSAGARIWPALRKAAACE